jgi:hypothetical protein
MDFPGTYSIATREDSLISRTFPDKKMKLPHNAAASDRSYLKKAMISSVRAI